MRYPTRDDLCWFSENNKQSELQLNLSAVSNVQILADCERFQWLLKYLWIEDQLETQEDISLLKLIYRQSPSARINMTLVDASLLRPLLDDFHKPMCLSIFEHAPVSCETIAWEGLEVICEHTCLQHLIGLDLSSMSNLEIFFSSGFGLDSALANTLAAVLKESPNLEGLYMHTNSRERELGEFPVLLRRILDANGKCYRTFPTFNADGSYFAFVTKFTF